MMQFNEKNVKRKITFCHLLLKQSHKGYFDTLDRIDKKIVPCSCSMSVQAILEP